MYFSNEKLRVWKIMSCMYIKIQITASSNNCLFKWLQIKINQRKKKIEDKKKIWKDQS